MKIDQAIVLCLLKNKQVTLKGIGRFTIDENFPENADPEKPTTIPPESISFFPDSKAPEDEELINFLAQNTKKMKSLASSDIDSYLTLGREFLNIGNPFIIHNLGSLEKTGAGQLQFTPGKLVLRPVTLTPKIEAEETVSGREDTQEENGPEDNRGLPFNRNLLLIILLVLIATGVAWYFGFRKQGPDQSKTSQSIVPIGDSVTKKGSLSDTITSGKIENPIVLEDTLGHHKIIPFSTYTFLIVVKTTHNREAAIARYRRLEHYGRNVILFTKDSVIYKVAHPFTLPLYDTAKVLDSLNSYYYLGRAHVELK